jgi:hypothetical protein
MEKFRSGIRDKQTRIRNTAYSILYPRIFFVRLLALANSDPSGTVPTFVEPRSFLLLLASNCLS